MQNSKGQSKGFWTFNGRQVTIFVDSSLKAASNCTKNLKTFTTGITKFQNVAQSCKSCVGDLQDTIPKFKSMIENADEIGLKASEEGKTSMPALMDYHSGEKKTGEEMNGGAKIAE